MTETAREEADRLYSGDGLSEEDQTWIAALRRGHEVYGSYPGDLGHVVSESDKRTLVVIDTLLALLAAEREARERMEKALGLAAVRLEILTGRMRACHEETGQHELLDEAEAFCREARTALNGERNDE